MTHSHVNHGGDVSFGRPPSGMPQGGAFFGASKPLQHSISNPYAYGRLSGYESHTSHSGSDAGAPFHSHYPSMPSHAIPMPHAGSLDRTHSSAIPIPQSAHAAHRDRETEHGRQYIISNIKIFRLSAASLKRLREYDKGA